MKLRIVSVFAWFYTGWYAGAILADMFGVSPLLGLIIGAASAGLIVGDPLRLIWIRAGTSPSAMDNVPEAA